MSTSLFVGLAEGRQNPDVTLWSVGSLVRPKVVRSVHYCPATKKTMERKYTDLTSLDAFPSSAIYPTKVQVKPPS